MVWAPPVSLAATSGIDVSFFSSGYLDVSVHRVPFHALWIGAWILEVCSSGFPHSEICGSVDICSSPQLFAAYHVFHRLLVPRHPPCALLCFTNIPCIALHVCLAFELLKCCFFSDVLLTDLEFTPHPCTREQVRSFADIRRISALCLSSTVIGMQAFLRLCLPARPVNSSHYFLGYFCFSYAVFKVQMGLSRLELPTSRLSGVRSNLLSYKPIMLALSCSSGPSPARYHRPHRS